MSRPAAAAAGHGTSDGVGPRGGGGAAARARAAGGRVGDAARAGMAAADTERWRAEPGGSGLAFLAQPELGVAASGAGERAAAERAGAGAGGSDLVARGDEVPAAYGARQSGRQRGAGRRGGEGEAHQPRGRRDLCGLEGRLGGVSAAAAERAAALPEDQARAGPGGGLGEPGSRLHARPRGRRGALAPCLSAVDGSRLVHGGARTRGGAAVRRAGDRRPDQAP